MDFDTLEGVKQALGVNNIRDSGRSPNYAYSYTFSFAAIAAAGVKSVIQKVTAAGAFVVYAVTGSVHDGAGAAVLSKLITLSFSTNDGPWQQGQEAWDNCVGTAIQPYYPLFRPVAGPSSQIQFDLTNNTAGAITGSVTLKGYILGRSVTARK